MKLIKFREFLLEAKTDIKYKLASPLYAGRRTIYPALAKRLGVDKVYGLYDVTTDYERTSSRGNFFQHNEVEYKSFELKPAAISKLATKLFAKMKYVFFAVPRKGKHPYDLVIYTDLARLNDAVYDRDFEDIMRRSANKEEVTDKEVKYIRKVVGETRVKTAIRTKLVRALDKFKMETGDVLKVDRRGKFYVHKPEEQKATKTASKSKTSDVDFYSSTGTTDNPSDADIAAVAKMHRRSVARRPHVGRI